MHLILSGAPQSTNHLYKIFNRGMYMSAEGRKLKRSYQCQAKSQLKLKRPITGRIGVSMALFFGDKRKRDIDNYNKIVLDSLNGIVYVDDNQIHQLRIWKEYDKDNPRIEIRIGLLDSES